ncbi:hypothetical protein L596_008011 [Steinernema carpocapsae]|uniref:Uncharacterized protein n=1 Tax=Steinernema carpocapsae TaxID=34508 RepID=A0A4U5PB94_STECR|nr:hypothetical protein L596_008011 [Steinernema carpocapsae]
MLPFASLSDSQPHVVSENPSYAIPPSALQTACRVKDCLRRPRSAAEYRGYCMRRIQRALHSSSPITARWGKQNILAAVSITACSTGLSASSPRRKDYEKTS